MTSGGESLAAELVGNQQRGVSGSVASEPGELLELHQLIDERILELHQPAEPRRQLVKGLEQAVSLVVDLLRQRWPALGLRLQDGGGGFVVQRGELLDGLVEARYDRLSLGKIDRIQRHHGGFQGRHLAFASRTEHRRQAGELLVGHQIAEGGRAVHTQVMQRREHVARGLGDGGDPLHCDQPLPRAPGSHREHHHHGGGERRDHGLQDDID
jgi:hypothetical protein